jgi:soluble lytic murein transglycosylase-like protein
VPFFLPSSLPAALAPVLGALRRYGEALTGLAAVIAIVIVAAVTPHKPAALQHPAALQRPAHTKMAAAKPAKPAASLRKPSAFAREQQMSFGELMNRWNPTIATAAKKYGVPQPWIRAVIQIESGGRTMLGENQPIKSNMGAMGLMQLMPQTYNDMRVQYGLGDDPYDPHDNIMAGTAYLRFLRAKYGYPAMFAAYNDGPGNLEARMMGRGLLPQETQNYMVNIATALAGGKGGRGVAVKFTRPNGDAAMINPFAVSSVRAAFPGEYAPGVQTVITMGRLHQGVRESMAQVRAAIRAHGGGI